MSTKNVRWQKVYITVQQFNEILDKMRERRTIIHENAENLYKAGKWTQFRNTMYVWETGRGSVRMSFRIGTKCFNYVTVLDGLDEQKAETEQLTGSLSYGLMQRMSTIRGDYQTHLSEYSGPEPFKYNNPKFSGCDFQKAWSYDLNSAYCFILMKYKFPDLANDLGEGVVEEDEIGFSFDGCELRHPGRFAQYRFKLVDSPYVHFANKMYEKILYFKSRGQKNKSKKFKGIINSAVGNLKYHRPLHRNYIVASINEYMKNIMEKYKGNILYGNTDCVVSTIPLDLDVGINCGQFKLEDHGENMFKYRDNTYQWRGEVPVASGRSKGLWKATDDLFVGPSGDYIYKYDYEKELIVRCGSEQEF